MLPIDFELLHIGGFALGTLGAVLVEHFVVDFGGGVVWVDELTAVYVICLHGVAELSLLEGAV